MDCVCYAGEESSRKRQFSAGPYLRVLKPNGILAVIHWNYDPTTPRGPAMEIRPRPEECIAWGREAGFCFDAQSRYDLPPYHYGLLFRKS